MIHLDHTTLSIMVWSLLQGRAIGFQLLCLSLYAMESIGGQPNKPCIWYTGPKPA